MKTIKKLEGQRWFIWTIVFLVVSLIGLACYVWVAAELDNNQPEVFSSHKINLNNKEDKILSRVKQALIVNNLFQIPNDCIAFSLDSSTSPDYYFVDLRENHTAPKCGGDPSTAPFLVTFRISKTTGKMETDYNSSNGEFSPISEELLESDFINTSWIPDDGTDAVLSFLSTKNNDPKHKLYDYKIAADSRMQEVGYWEFKNGKIIPTVTQVLATPQEIIDIEPVSEALLIRTSQVPEGFKLIKVK